MNVKGKQNERIHRSSLPVHSSFSHPFVALCHTFVALPHFGGFTEQV
jgi:hypothetical protein